MKMLLFYISTLISMNIYAQKFKRIGYSFNKVDLLTKGVQTGIKELEFKNQHHKVIRFLNWKIVSITGDIYYNNEPFPYSIIATGKKSSDTIRLNIVDQNIRYGKKKPFVCRKNQSVFLITSGMYVYELVE